MLHFPLIWLCADGHECTCSPVLFYVFFWHIIAWANSHHSRIINTQELREFCTFINIFTFTVKKSTQYNRTRNTTEYTIYKSTQNCNTKIYSVFCSTMYYYYYKKNKIKSQNIIHSQYSLKKHCTSIFVVKGTTVVLKNYIPLIIILYICIYISNGINNMFSSILQQWEMFVRYVTFFILRR